MAVNNSTPFTSYRIWRNLSGLVLFAAPFATWQLSAFKGSRSLVSFVYYCWLETFEQFSTAALFHNVVITICLLILLATGFLLSLGFVQKEIRVTMLMLNLLFIGTIFISGTVNLGWGYWLYGTAIMMSLVLEGVEAIVTASQKVAPPTHIDRRQLVI